jgi:hypothetical protein
MNCKDELISNRGGGPGLSNIEENIVFSERERDSKNVLEKTDKHVG